MNIDECAYRVIWSQEDGEYVGLCADFPSLSWLAATKEAAMSGIRAVVLEVVSDVRLNGDDCVGPSALETS